MDDIKAFETDLKEQLRAITTERFSKNIYPQERARVLKYLENALKGYRVIFMIDVKKRHKANTSSKVVYQMNLNLIFSLK